MSDVQPPWYRRHCGMSEQRRAERSDRRRLTRHFCPKCWAADMPKQTI
jgi:hypothetical protein